MNDLPQECSFTTNRKELKLLLELSHLLGNTRQERWSRIQLHLTSFLQSHFKPLHSIQSQRSRHNLRILLPCVIPAYSLSSLPSFLTLREKSDPSKPSNAHIQKRRVFQTARRGRQQRVSHLTRCVEHTRKREIVLVHDSSRCQILSFRKWRNKKRSRVFCEERRDIFCFTEMERQGRIAVSNEWIGLCKSVLKRKRFHWRRNRCVLTRLAK